MSETVGGEITTEELDVAENEVFVRHLDRYVEGASSPHDYIVSYRDCVKHESPQRNSLGRDSLRGYAGHAVKDDFGSRDPFLKVTREIATEMALSYFKSLERYLEAKKTGDKDVDAIVREISLSSGMLLRQIEGVLEDFKPPRSFRNWNWKVEDLEKLIDLKKVEEDSDFYNLFPGVNVNHYVGVAGNRNVVGETHTSHSGLRAEDILGFLNSAEDVDLFQGEGSNVIDMPERLVAKICRTGVIEILEREG